MWAAAGGAAMATAVAAGAFGAHGLEARLSAVALGWWHTAAQYHCYHGLGLFAVAWLASRGAPVRVAGWLMVIGLVLFSGSLYLLALTGLRWLGMVTPLGGTAWIIAWVMVARAALHDTPAA